MGLFGFLKPPKPVPFTYRPRFYDEKREAFKERLKKAEELAGDNPEALKARIRNSLQRKGTYLTDKSYRQRQLMRSNMLLLVIVVLLVLIAFLGIEVYLPRIVEMFE
ncbi:MAG: hypothetical protein EPO28_06935 [Saprospiraceae bacterium]|nr:MAG: hypothetical protein EPO28_06935 [Saprospiraceae bacterium]